MFGTPFKTILLLQSNLGTASCGSSSISVPSPPHRGTLHLPLRLLSLYLEILALSDFYIKCARRGRATEKRIPRWKREWDAEGASVTFPSPSLWLGSLEFLTLLSLFIFFYIQCQLFSDILPMEHDTLSVVVYSLLGHGTDLCPSVSQNRYPIPGIVLELALHNMTLKYRCQKCWCTWYSNFRVNKY